MATIRWLQALMEGPGWDQFWILVTKLYSEDVMVALVPILYWVANRSTSRFLAALFLVNIWVNDLLKALVWRPRPPAEGIRVIAVDTGSNLGFPSGHAQGSAVVWTALATEVRRSWFSVLAAVAILLVGLSRLYLGVHWPTDVLGGWAIGLLFTWAALRLRAPLGSVLSRLGVAVRVVLGFLVPLLMYAAATFIPVLARLESEHLVPVLGALAGFLVGTVLEEEYVGFDPRAPLTTQVVKIAVGLALVLGVRVGLKAIFPAAPLWDFLRYVAVALSATLVAPWIFKRWLGAGGRPSRRAA